MMQGNNPEAEQPAMSVDQQLSEWIMTKDIRQDGIWLVFFIG